MKKFKWIAGIVVLVVMGGYTGFWFYSAGCLKEIVMDKCRDFPLEHKGVTCKGFPFALEVEIIDPAISSKIAERSDGKVSTDGNWTIGTTILGSRGWFQIAGKTAIEVSDTKRVNFILSGKLRAECSQPIKSLKFSKHFENILTNRSIGNFMFSAENLSIAAGEDIPPFFLADSWICSFDNILAASPYTFGRFVKIDWCGVEVQAKNLGPLLALSSLPKQDIWWLDLEDNSGKGDLSLHARILASVKGEDEFAIDLDVKKFDFKNALDSHKTTGQFVLNGDPSTGFDGIVCCHSASQYGSRSRHDVEPTYRALAQYYQKIGFFAKHPNWGNLFTNHWDQVAQLIPEYAPGCTSETHIDLSYQIPKKTADRPANWSCDLKNFSLKMPPYEFAMQGYKGLEKSRKTDFLDIQLSNHEQAIQDLAQGYNRLQSVVISTQTLSAMEMPPVNGNAVKCITRFLESLSSPSKDQPDNLRIVIQWKDPQDVRIGPFNLQTFNPAFGQFIVDFSQELFPAGIPGFATSPAMRE
jgi:hypothetical protein